MLQLPPVVQTRFAPSLRGGSSRPTVKQIVLAALAVISAITTAFAADRQNPPTNIFGAAVRDPQGGAINYSSSELPSMESIREPARKAMNAAPSASQIFVPPSAGTTRPFWQYAIFGSGIGLSNIVIGPAPAGGGAHEIIVGGNSNSNFGGDDFWQVIRRNSTTGNYDQLFVSPIYSETILRIAVGNLIGDSRQELAVMLRDGRIYLYDLVSKADLGYINTGVTWLEGLALADLDTVPLDGYAEVIVTTANDLFVFNGAGNLLWQVPGAGGYDVVAGQMDDDPAVEIAATKGVVVDAVTHMSQWTRSGGFGYYLKLAPLPGANYQQLIAAEAWSYVYSYDVAKQLPRWSISTFDIDAIQIGDVDNDGTPEVIIGDGQWGTVHVHDLITQAQKWETDNPEHGVTNIAVGDVDNDGVADLVWGAGWTSSGADYLYISSTTGAHAIKWQNVDLQGPFLGPVIGYLDGDGTPELVVCSLQSDSGYDSGRILVFDLPSLTLRATSPPVINNRAWTGVHDLKLRDLDGDGRMEIVIAADDLYDGGIEVYGFDSANTFTSKWHNTTRPVGSPFTFVEVTDLDADGTPEIIAGNTVEHTGSEGVYVYIFDYPATDNPWRSVNLASGFNSVTGLVVQDLDENGGKDIAALVGTGDLYTFDGPARELKSLKQQTGGTLIADRHSPSGLILGDTAGVGHFWQYASNSYSESFFRQLGSEALSGVTVIANGELWTGTGGTLTLRLPPSYSDVTWATPVVGSGFGRFVATDFRNDERHVFSSAKHAVVGFKYESPLAPPPPSPTPIPTATPSPTATPTPSPIVTPTPNITPSPTPFYTPTPTGTPLPTVTPTPAESPSATTTPTPTETATATPTPVDISTPTPTPAAQSLNISTRLNVLTGDNVLIGGFIITGNAPKKVIIRAIGSSLPVDGALADPTLELHTPAGDVLTNNDWKFSDETLQSQEDVVRATTVPPTDDRESALVHTLWPGAYTAIVRGNGGGTGVALIEVYDLDPTSDSNLANISTRGFVETGSNVIIGGFIVGPEGSADARVAVRAIGPSLPVAGALQDPVLELHDADGSTMATNDNWQDDRSVDDLQAINLQPQDTRESAMIRTLLPGLYTVIVRGSGDATGVALVEVYNLDSN
jgi:hypothetical protein